MLLLRTVIRRRRRSCGRAGRTIIIATVSHTRAVSILVSVSVIVSVPTTVSALGAETTRFVGSLARLITGGGRRHFHGQSLGGGHHGHGELAIMGVVVSTTLGGISLVGIAAVSLFGIATAISCFGSLVVVRIRGVVRFQRLRRRTRYLWWRRRLGTNPLAAAAHVTPMAVILASLKDTTEGFLELLMGFEKAAMFLWRLLKGRTASKFMDNVFWILSGRGHDKGSKEGGCERQTLYRKLHGRCGWFFLWVGCFGKDECVGFCVGWMWESLGGPFLFRRFRSLFAQLKIVRWAGRVCFRTQTDFGFGWREI